MERESLLTVLVVLLGGVALQPLAMLPLRPTVGGAHGVERHAWLRLWLPVMPAMLVAAWLCGWALREPDPVDDRLSQWVLIGACLPFALIAARAVARAVWALGRDPRDADVCTVGLLRPRVLFSPFLARTLDDAALQAAWQHEQAHACHRDPLRIWLAQLATDLQWPWPGARARFDGWLEALECARDDEARSLGTSGEDLAAALLTTLRHTQGARKEPSRPGRSTIQAHALLVGDRDALQRRIERLLAPLPESQMSSALTSPRIEARFAGLLMVAGLLGALYGEPILRHLLAWTS
ncbi:hypothetical protein WJ542_19005 [Paraburkholderia sp. B3]|uniref:hypothetical protein n=1 Tax=Paraburkholderia sp. B3 TaxID=3134791 RepID=UPI003982A57C